MPPDIKFPDPDRFSETHYPGPDSTFRTTGFFDFPFLLDRHGIRAAGHTIARGGNRFVRLNPPTIQILVCCKGQGYALIDKQWVTLNPGMAYVTPSDTCRAYFGTADIPFEFSWVIYDNRKPNFVAKLLKSDRPYIIKVDPNLLSFPIQGLHNESIHKQDETTMDSWVRLVNTYVRRALSGDELDPRLRRLWIAIEEDIAADWTSRSMAKIAGISEEHLRRLCHRVHQQSPRQRLVSLRIRDAAELLSFSELSLEEIAEHVGYSDAATLSRAFSRHQGESPSRYRRKVREGH